MDVDYEFSPAFTLMTANLGPGESLKVEPGAMVAQSRGVDMKTGMGGGGSTNVNTSTPTTKKIHFVDLLFMTWLS